MSKDIVHGLFKYLRENVSDEQIEAGMIKAWTPPPIKESEESETIKPEVEEKKEEVEVVVKEEIADEGKVPTNKDDSEKTRKELLEQGDKEVVLGTFSDEQVAKQLAQEKRGVVVEDAETKMFKVVVKEKIEEVVDEEVDEKKAMPTCSKCNKKHWPFNKCGAGKAKAKGEDKDEPKEKGKSKAKKKDGGNWWEKLAKKKKKDESVTMEELEALAIEEGIEINIKDAGGEATVKVKTDGQAAEPEVIVNDEPVVELPNDEEPPIEAPEETNVDGEEVVEELPLESKVAEEAEPIEEPVEEAKVEEGSDDFTMGFVEALQKSLKEVVGVEVKVDKIINKLKTTDRVGLEALKVAMEQKELGILKEFLNMLLENKEEK